MQTSRDAAAVPEQPEGVHERDAFLFILAGHLALGTGFGVWIAISSGPLSETDPGSVGFILSVSAWAVLWVAGVLKCVEARRTGAPSGRIHLMLASMTFLSCVILHCILDVTELWWTHSAHFVFAVAMTISALIHSVIRQRDAEVKARQDGVICSAVGVAAIAFACFFHRNFHERSDTFIRALATVNSHIFGVVWLVLSVAGAAQTIRNRRAGLASRWTLWGNRLTWVNAAILVDVAIWHAPLPHESYRLFLLLAVSLSAISIAVGCLLATLRRKQAPSLLRRVAFCSPLVFFSVSLVAPSVVLFKHAPEIYYDGKDPAGLYNCSWAWTMPEIFVLPIAEQFESTRCYYCNLSYYPHGLARLNTLRQDASGVRPDTSGGAIPSAALVGWQLRDREGALEFACTVGQGQPQRAAQVELIAGVLVGTSGTDQQVIERLAGDYSLPLKEGILGGLRWKKRDRFFTEHIVKLADQTGAAWRCLVEQPEKSSMLYREYLKSPTSPMAAVVKRVADNDYIWRQMDLDVVKEGLYSDDTAVRKIALAWHKRVVELPTADWRRILECAAGNTPGCDALEQRRAAFLLEAGLLKKQRALTIPRQNKLSAPITPLTPAEFAEIITVCTRADAVLSK
jgi:hypothetical protein